MVDDVVPVQLIGGIPESSVIKGFARSVSLSLHGVLSLDNGVVVLEWSGTRHIAEAGRGTARSAIEPVPLGRVSFPVASLRRVLLRRSWRRWWKPQIELGSSDLAALQAVPTMRAGRIVLGIARVDRQAAADLVSRIELAAADHALAAAEERQALPPADLPRLPP